MKEHLKTIFYKKLFYSLTLGILFDLTKNMNTILFLSLVSIVSSLAIAYISLKFAKSEEAEIVNEIQMKYPNNTLYYG